MYGDVRASLPSFTVFMETIGDLGSQRFAAATVP